MIYTRGDIRKKLVIMLILGFILGWFCQIGYYQFQEYRKIPRDVEEIGIFLRRLENKIDDEIQLYKIYAKAEGKLREEKRGDTGQKW
ncbi:unnamed protein product [marine sediment metagenome]|uniref:Uncharacterized protein n=1 Tax=marine sediment metagenome TaxID=412755 RepID=X1N8I0_9ZZZZ